MYKPALYFMIFCIISCGKDSGDNPTPTPPPTDTTTFINPLLSSGPDPFVAQKDNFYYYTETQVNKISIWKTTKMSELKSVAPVTVWTAVPGTAYSNDVWAPEI